MSRIVHLYPIHCQQMNDEQFRKYQAARDTELACERCIVSVDDHCPSCCQGVIMSVWIPIYGLTLGRAMRLKRMSWPDIRAIMWDVFRPLAISSLIATVGFGTGWYKAAMEYSLHYLLIGATIAFITKTWLKIPDTPTSNLPSP